jgi:hypothetical protein
VPIGTCIGRVASLSTIVLFLVSWSPCRILGGLWPLQILNFNIGVMKVVGAHNHMALRGDTSLSSW